MNQPPDQSDDATPPTLPGPSSGLPRPSVSPTDPTLIAPATSLSAATWEALMHKRGGEMDGEETLSHSPAELPTLSTHAAPPQPADEGDFPAELTHHGFRAMGLLGQGGLGAVYLAVQPVLERAVAVKVGRSPQAGRHLQAEARAAAAVEHPAVVPIHAAGSGHLVMRHLRGATFSDLRRAGEALESLIADLRLVLDGLACAHGHGLLHRDLKPANLMRDERGGVAIIDWGLAAAISPQAEAVAPPLSQATVCAGTPAYLPPEVARGDLAALGPASDVFLIGAVMYHLLSGKAPYAGRQRQALFRAAACDWAPLEDVDSQLAALQAACMDADPARRPSLAQLAEGLDHWLAGRQRLREAQRFAAAAEVCASEIAASSLGSAAQAWAAWSEALGLARTAADLGHAEGPQLLARLQAQAVGSVLDHGSLLLARHGLGQMAQPPPELCAAVAAAEGRRRAQIRRWRRAQRLTIAAALVAILAAGWMWRAIAVDQGALRQAEDQRRSALLGQAQDLITQAAGPQLPALAQAAMTLAALGPGAEDDAHRRVRQAQAAAVADWAIAHQRGDWFHHLAPSSELVQLPPPLAAELAALRQRLDRRWAAVDAALDALAVPTADPWALVELVAAVQRLPRDADVAAALRPRLWPLLSAALPAQRLRVLELLLDRHPSAAAEACWLLIDDPDEQLRRAAVRGLGQLRRDKDLDALAQHLLAHPALGSPELAEWGALVATLAAHPPLDGDDGLGLARVWRSLGRRAACEAAVLAVPEEQRGAEHWDLLLSFYGIINYLGGEERSRLQHWARARLALGHDIQAARLLFALSSRFIYPSADRLDEAIAEVQSHLQAAAPDQVFVLWELVRYFPAVFPGPVPDGWHHWHQPALASLRRAQASGRPLTAPELTAALAILAPSFPDEARRIIHHFNDRFPGVLSWRYWRWVGDGGRRLAHIGRLYDLHARRPTDHQLLMELARAELDRGDLPRALIMGRLAAARHPRDGECLNAHGLALAAHGYHPAAVARFRQADRALPGNLGVLAPGAHSARQAGLWGDHLYFQQRLARTPRGQDHLLSTLLSHGAPALDLALATAAEVKPGYRSWYLLHSWPALWPALGEGPHARSSELVAAGHLLQALAWATASDPDLLPQAPTAVEAR